MNTVLENLIAALGRLPSVGRKTAERMAYSLIENHKNTIKVLEKSLSDARQFVECCSNCGYITETSNNPCSICLSSDRDSTILCIVESSKEVNRIEELKFYSGKYHVLQGRISPLHGTSCNDLSINQLLIRIKKEKIQEIIFALNNDVESDATMYYLIEVLASYSIRLTSLGTHSLSRTYIDYMDEKSLREGFQNRIDV